MSCPGNPTIYTLSERAVIEHGRLCCPPTILIWMPGCTPGSQASLKGRIATTWQIPGAPATGARVISVLAGPPKLVSTILNITIWAARPARISSQRNLTKSLRAYFFFENVISAIIFLISPHLYLCGFLAGGTRGRLTLLPRCGAAPYSPFFFFCSPASAAGHW